MSAPRPKNEEARLDALHRLNILDTDSETAFDHITTLAQTIFDVSSAAISFVAQDRQWFKSMCGWEVEETPRDQSFCTYAIMDDAIMVVEDVGADDRFHFDPDSTAGSIQFYAGAPLCLNDDLRVGTLCLLDDTPRSFDADDRHTFAQLADIVVELLEARRKTHQIGYMHSALEEAEDAVVITEAAPLNPPGPRIMWVNKAFSRMTGYDREEIVGENPRILQGPETDRSVLNKVRSALENERAVHAETVNYRKDGTPYVVSWHIAPVHNDDGTLTHWVSVQRDVTDQQRRKERLKHEATHDSLTGLPNRYAVQETVEELVTSRPGRHTALLYLDLDRFKPINDEFGHQVGDQVLVKTAEALQTVVRRDDTIGRIGGDEFVICLSNLDTPDEARSVANRLHEALSTPFQIGPHNITVRASIGGTITLSAYETADDALHVADMAMYEAKNERTEENVVIWDRARGQEHTQVLSTAA